MLVSEFEVLPPPKNIPNGNEKVTKVLKSKTNTTL